MRIFSIILFCLLIVLVECAGDESKKNLHLFSELLKNILKQFGGEERTSASNDVPLSMSYNASAEMLNIIEEKIVKKILHLKCNEEMKIDFYEMISKSGLFKINNHKKNEKISREGNIQMVKLLLSFAIRLISIIGENELNQILVKESNKEIQLKLTTYLKNLFNKTKEIKLANFLDSYNCMEKVLPNAQMKSIYPFRILLEHLKLVITFDGNTEQNFELKFETLRKLYSLEKYTIMEWIKNVKYIERIEEPNYEYQVTDTHNSQDPLDLLMVAWTGNTEPYQWLGYNFELYDICAIKNFGINMAELLMRESTISELNEFPALKRDFENAIEKMKKMLKEYQEEYFTKEKYELWKENFTNHYEDAIIFGQTLSKEYQEIVIPITKENHEIVKKTEEMILNLKEHIKYCIENHIEKCFENEYNKMSREIFLNLDEISRLIKNGMLLQLKTEYIEKIEELENLTNKIKKHKLSKDHNTEDKNAQTKFEFEENNTEWGREKKELEKLMEKLLEILKRSLVKSEGEVGEVDGKVAGNI